VRLDHCNVFSHSLGRKQQSHCARRAFLCSILPQY
jgi:hypothetical protein